MQTKQKIILSFLTAVIIGGGAFWLTSLGKEKTDDAAIEGHITPISAKISGYVVKLNVVDNQEVKKGDVLLEIDTRDYELKVNAMKALLASAKISAQNAEVNANRQIAIGKAAGTQKDIDNAAANKSTSFASVDNAKAQFDIAEKDLADTKIVAPEDGVVTMRTVEQGAYITPGLQLMSIVGLDRWVVANFKEVQIADMRQGEKAKIEVDAYPHLKLTGLVDSIQSGTGARFSPFPPENATGNFVKIVQRVPVKILIADKIPDDVVLGPGLSVVPTVFTSGK